LAGLFLGARTSLSSLAIVEYVFTWNGAGYGFILAVANGNIAFAAAIALVFAVALASLGRAVGLAGRVVAVTARVPEGTWDACCGMARSAWDRAGLSRSR